MAERTAVIFGADATKACGGPLTDEILSLAFDRQSEIEREGFLRLLDEFWWEISIFRHSRQNGAKLICPSRERASFTASVTAMNEVTS